MKSRYVVSVLVVSVWGLGCTSLRVVSGGGGAVAYVGPVSIEARASKSGALLPKFQTGKRLHIVGQGGEEFRLRLKNLTDRRWRLRLGGEKRTMVLWPGKALRLSRGSLLSLKPRLRFPHEQGRSARSLGKLKLSLFAFDRATPKASPDYRLQMTYGLCVGYQAKKLYSRWCPGPQRIFFAPPSAIPQTTFIRWERPVMQLRWEF